MLRRTHRNQRTPRPDTTQPISSRQAHHPTQHLGKISDRQWGNSKIRSTLEHGLPRTSQAVLSGAWLRETVVMSSKETPRAQR